MPLEQITDPQEISSLDITFQSLPKTRISAPELISTPQTRFNRVVETSPNLEEVTDPKEIAKYNEWAAEKPTPFSEFLYGARTGSGFVENSGDALINLMSSSGQEKASYLNYLFDAINQGTINPDPSMVEGETGDSARTLTAQRDVSGVGVDQAISSVPDLQRSNAEIAGKIGAAIADPTSLIPIAPAKFGGKYIAALLTGAGVGGADTLMYQAAKTGELNPTEAAKYAAYGAILGGGLHALGTELPKVLAAAKELNTPITEDVLKNIADNPNIRKLPSPEASREGEVIPGNREPTIPTSRVGETIDSINQQKLLNGPENIEGTNIGRSAIGQETNRLANPQDVLEGEFRVISENSTALRTELTKALESGDYQAAAKTINETFKLGWDGSGSTAVKDAATEDALWKSVPEEETVFLTKAYGLPIKIDLTPPLKATNNIPTEQQAVNDLLPKEDGNMAKTKLLTKQKEAGFTNTHILSPLAGAGMGYLYTGDLNGAFWGAAIGGALPYGAGLFAKRIGRGTKAASTDPIIIAKASEDMDVAAVQGWTIRSPSYILKTKFGGLGRKFDDLMEQAQTRFERTGGEVTWNINSYSRTARAKGISKDVVAKAEGDAMDYLRGVKPLGNLNGASIKIANGMSSYFSDVLKRAHKAGILDAKQYARLGHIAAKKGYFPRIYDMAYLSTGEGKADWITKFTSIGMKPEAIESTIKSIMGETEEARQLIRTYTSKTTGKDTLIYMDRKLAERLLNTFRKGDKYKGSTFLEQSRKLHVADESILDNFIVKDPKAALAMYIDNVEKRIAYANVFGAKHEKALAGMKYIEDKYGRAAGKMTGELYWQRVGDSRSEMIQKSADLADAQRELLGRVSAFQTLKLTLSAMANMTQATVNSAIAIGHISGGFKTNLRIMASIASDLKNNPKKFRETAERSGAALETSLMQIIGEFSSIEHRIAGREFQGKLSFLEYLNNPTKYLKVVGFIGAERLQRTLGSNIGRSYAELLIDDLQQAKALGKPTARIETQMKELKLDPTRTEWTEGEVLDAALRWSDQVNFRNTPGSMPLGWAHPHATWFRKFKQYSFNQSNFIMEHVIKPAWKADTLGKKAAGGLTLATAAGVIGVPIDALRNLLSGDDKDYTLTERYIRGLSTVGGFGLWYDIVRSNDVVTSLAGPVASDIATIATATKKFATSDEHSPVRYLSDLVLGTTNIPGEKKIKEAVRSNY